MYSYESNDKGKPVVRRGRKATGLWEEAAGLPKGVMRERIRPTFFKQASKVPEKGLWGAVNTPKHSP